MMKYITESTEKFKTDALSKAIYDFLKWLFLGVLLFAGTIFLPEKFDLTKYIFVKIQVSLYWFVIYSLVLITLTILGVRFFFKKKYNALQADNFTDELTGLKNHKALKEYLNKKLNEFKGSTKSLSLIIIDVDDFKKFNTEVGHNTADRILKQIGAILANDKRATDETFRYFLKGDEFLVVAEDTNLNEAILAAERKRKLIGNAIIAVDSNQYQLTVSCGVTVLKNEGDDFTTITDRVIAALNEAKKQIGKNCTKSIF